MDLEVTLPPSAQEISPILIVSPTSHAGTALLQRMMCQSSNGLCYGDNTFEELLSIVEWSTSLIDAHQGRQENEERVLAAALGRRPERWMPDLAPEFRIHMSSVFSTVYNLPHTAQAFAQENGYDVWGMIRGDMPAALLSDLLSVFPNGKAVLVHRNPFDTARDMLRDDPLADVNGLCNAWSLGMDGYLKTGHMRLAKLRYEDAVEDPGKFADAFSKAAGLNGLSADTVDAGDEASSGGDRELSDAERSMIAERCADMLAVYYPDLV